MRAKPIEQLLSCLPQLHPVLARARQLAELQRLYVEIAPARLSRYSRVANLEGATLIVFADNGAVGAKLKLLAPTLVNGFLLNAQQVTAVRVEVQANAGPVLPSPAKPIAPPQARQSIAQLEDQLPEGALKQALTSLRGKLD